MLFRSRNQASIRNLVIVVAGEMQSDRSLALGMVLDRPRAAADRVVEFVRAQDVFAGQDVLAHDAPGFANAQLRRDRVDARPLESRHVFLEKCREIVDLAAAFQMARAEAPGVSPIHTGNAACPMHHPAKSPSNCSCRGTTDPGSATLITLLGPVAVLADTPASAAPAPITTSPHHSSTKFTGVILVPDGPPPRA